MEKVLLITLIVYWFIRVKGFRLAKIIRKRRDFVLKMTSESASSVLVLGLNPALQKRVQFKKIQKGSVNRALGVGFGIGGKGQDVLVASLIMKKKSSIVVDISQFIGSGGEGDRLLTLLRERRIREGLWGDP